MKKFLFYICCLLLTSCATVIQIACNEPDVEVIVNHINYGKAPIVYKSKREISYVDVEFVRDGKLLHQQRLYLVGDQNYYEIDIPKHLRKSSTHKYHN